MFNKVHKGGAGLYFVGFVGAAVYYIGQADAFWSGVIGFLKAIVWPAFLVYKALSALGA
jgi:hypothetical protein